MCISVVQYYEITLFMLFVNATEPILRSCFSPGNGIWPDIRNRNTDDVIRYVTQSAGANVSRCVLILHAGIIWPERSMGFTIMTNSTRYTRFRQASCYHRGNQPNETRSCWSRHRILKGQLSQTDQYLGKWFWHSSHMLAYFHLRSFNCFVRKCLYTAIFNIAWIDLWQVKLHGRASWPEHDSPIGQE